MKIIDKLKKRFLNSPESATSCGWWEYETKTKSEKPILYFLLETMPKTIRRLWYRRVTHYFKYLKEKYYYKPHHVKIDMDRFGKTDRLGRKYYDIDHETLILLSSFQILVNEYEANIEYIENLKSHPITLRSEKWIEIEELYKWWTVDRVNYEKELDIPEQTVYDLVDNFWGIDDNGERNMDKPRYIEYMDEKDRIYALRVEFEVEVKEKLVRCVLALAQW